VYALLVPWQGEMDTDASYSRAMQEAIAELGATARKHNASAGRIGRAIILSPKSDRFQ